MNILSTAASPPLATFRRLGELSTRLPLTVTVYAAVPVAAGVTGGVNPLGIVKFSGELEDCSAGSEGPSDPDPAMIAPLRFPSIDSELPRANRIWGWAGTAIVSGSWEIEVGVGGATERTTPTSATAPSIAATVTIRRAFRLLGCILMKVP